MPKNPKKVATYLNLDLQKQIRKVMKKHRLPSFSSALRAIARLGLTTINEPENKHFVEREQKDS